MLEEEKVYKNIEIRSEEVQEVMERMPTWILRWGIILLSMVVLALLAGSFFFAYPDVITAEATVTTINPPAPIVSRASGKIKKLYVTDNQEVVAGDYLAVIENTAHTGDILLLKNRLKQMERDSLFRIASLPPLQLGDIQSAYITFLNAAREQENFRTLGFYDKKIDFQRIQISRQEKHLERMKRQAGITEEQFRLAGRRWEKDSLMHLKGGISGPERDNSYSAYLQSLQSVESAEGGLENQLMQIAQLKEELLNLQLEQLEKEGKINNDFSQAKEQLLIALRNWELQYALISPIEGKVTFISYWSENHTIGGGETAFVVVPQTSEEIVGKALLPIPRSGKVKIGQPVILRFMNYPDQEFGLVKGKVSSISLVPLEENYVMEIRFPDGLTTNYGITLPASQEMKATAEIVTEEMKLIEQFFLPMKKIWKKGIK